MQYLIHEDNMPKLTEKLKKIENKCNKYGCTFHYAEIGEEYQTVQHQKEVDCGNHTEVTDTYKALERFVLIEVEGTAIINNWEFLATLEHTENGNIIRSYSDYAIPEYYKTCAPNCDHCHSNRDRKDTYLILNTETNEIKQVGKTCLKDYTNGLSAEMAADFASYFDAIAKLNNYESMGGFTRRYFDTFDYLCLTNETVKKCGFVSKSKAEEEQKQSTVSKIDDFMYPNHSALNEIEEIHWNPDTDENRTEVKTMLQWLSEQTADSQYISNLQIACKNKYSERRDYGLLASLPAAYFKAMEKDAERKAREQAKAGQPLSAYVGNEGDKIKLENVTIKYISSYETQYGITCIFKITDTNGNVFIWRTNKNQVETSANEYKPIEEFTSIKGTIKAHNEYNSEKQTELTRCKVLL